MRQIEKLYNLLEEKQSAALLKRKLGYIMDLYGECDGSEVRSIVREIVENFSEMILILEKDGKRVISNGIEWDPEADVDEKEPYPWDPYGLAEIFDPEDENAILGTFETYLSCVAELSEPSRYAAPAQITQAATKMILLNAAFSIASAHLTIKPNIAGTRLYKYTIFLAPLNSLGVFALLLDYQAYRSAREVERFSEAVFDITLIREVEQLGVVTEKHKGRRGDARLSHIVNL